VHSHVIDRVEIGPKTRDHKVDGLGDGLHDGCTAVHIGASSVGDNVVVVER